MEPIKLTEEQVRAIMPTGYELMPDDGEWVPGTMYLHGDGWYKTNTLPANRRFIHIRPIPLPKWWFDMERMVVTRAMEARDEASVEVTEKYAEYLRSKPDDGPWELRRSMKGDEYWSYAFSMPGGKAVCDFVDEGPCDRGVRWCRPRPVMGWVEYDVTLRQGAYQFRTRRGGSDAFLWSTAASLPGYGGTLYDTGTEHWLFAPALTRPEGGNGGVIRTPLKVRFWREIGSAKK
jgi:hypothetical protein